MTSTLRSMLSRMVDRFGWLEVPPVECYLDTCISCTTFTTFVLGSSKNTLSPTWRYTPAGIVWRLVPTASGKLIGEARDVQKKSTSFFCVNVRTGEVLWEGARFGEPWWLGIEAVHNDTLLLHKFATPDLPEHRAVIAVDVLTGEELWRNEEVTFERLGITSLRVVRAQPFGAQHVRLDYRTGAPVESAERDVADRPHHDLLDETELPTPLYDLTTDEPATVLFRHFCSPAEIVLPVDVVEREECVVYGYYERLAAPTDERVCMKNILLVVDSRSGEEVFRDVINAWCWIAAPESFFVSHDMLLYVRERTTLTAVALRQSH